MKNLSILFLYCTIAYACLSSCGKNEAACGSLGWTFDLQDELNNLSEATTAYAQDDSPANCNAYKQAYLDYIDALRGWERCLEAGNDREEWQQALNQAEQEANSILC